MKYTERSKRTNRFIAENTQLFEEVSHAVMARLDYAAVVDENIMEGRLNNLLLEELTDDKLRELEDAAEAAKADIEEFLGEISELGMPKTVAYLEDLKGKLPGTFGLVKMAFFGDEEEAAKKIGEVTSVSTKLQLAKDSVASAIGLVGSELGKLPFADESNWDKFKDEKADEDGNLDVDGEKVDVEDLIKMIQDGGVGEVLDRAAEMQGALADFKFPSTDDVFNAAKNQYKPPSQEQPSGMWGKLMSVFAKGDLKADDFANDIMDAPLGALIAKAADMQAAAAEASGEADAAEGDMADIQDEIQALSQGDRSGVEGEAPAGGGKDAEVDVKGIGSIPLTPQLMRLIFPGAQDVKPQDVAAAKAAEIPELNRTVIQKLGLPDEFGKQLAALINDDPKSPVFFANPKEAEKAQDEAPQDKKNEWVHQQGLTSLLLNEDIFYKDVENLLKTVVGTVDDLETDDDIPPFAGQLSKRLANQYDVKIQDMPGEAKDAADDKPKDDADKENEGDPEADGDDKASLGDKVAEFSTNLANEFTSPDTAAAALGALGADDPDSAASLFLDLSPPMKVNALTALAKMKEASGKDLAKALGKVGDMSEEEIAKISEMQVSFDGIQLTADILRTLDGKDFETALTALDPSGKSGLVQKIFKASIKLDDIASLKPKEVQLLLNTIEPMKFAIALKPRGLDDKLTKYILGNMSKTDGEDLADSIEKVDGDSEGAAKDIVDAIYKLGHEAAGSFDLKRMLKMEVDRRRGALLSNKPYYKKGRLSEVLLGPRRVANKPSKVDEAETASRMLRLAGLEGE
jgi:hypothetical protein